MAKHLTLLVDMDGTIEYLLPAWLGRINKRYGKNITVEDLKEWDLAKAYPGLTTEQIMNESLDDDMWDEIQPIPYAAEVLKRLKDRGHQIYIVTATPYQSVPAKMDRLFFKYFPFFNWSDVILTEHKQLLKGDVMIDDGIHNLIGGDYQKILFDQPYNRYFDAEANGMTRVTNWLEIEEIIKKIAEE